MSTDFDAMKAAYEAYKVEVNADVTALLGKVTDLTNQLANASNTDPDAVTLMNEILADTAALHASTNPAPVVPPVVTPDPTVTP